jgi:hypothetical protein
MIDAVMKYRWAGSWKDANVIVDCDQRRLEETQVDGAVGSLVPFAIPTKDFQDNPPPGTAAGAGRLL